MHLIYVDESGDDGFSLTNHYVPGTTPTKYFQRCGVMVHDRQWRKINRLIDDFKDRYSIPDDVELHATEIISGQEKFYDHETKKRKRRKNWYGKNLPRRQQRETLLLELCQLISSLNLTIIAVLIDKSKLLIDTEKVYKTIPKDNSWEYLIERVNLFLSTAKDRKGMFISDAINMNIEKKHREFATAIYKTSTHVEGHRFIESILFEPSDSSNLLQIADVVSFAIFKKHETRDVRYYNKLKNRIFKHTGKIKGYGLKIWP